MRIVYLTSRLPCMCTCGTTIACFLLPLPRIAQNLDEGFQGWLGVLDEPPNLVSSHCNVRFGQILDFAAQARPLTMG
jgi:hypothetical protein